MRLALVRTDSPARAYLAWLLLWGSGNGLSVEELQVGRAESEQDGRTLPPSSPGPVMGHTRTSLRGLPKLFAWRNMEKGSWDWIRLEPLIAWSENLGWARWQT